MFYPISLAAIIVSGATLCAMLAAGFFLQRRAFAAPIFFAAHHRFGAWISGLAMAGNFLSGALLLGIVGVIGFHGFEGLLLALPLAAGWVPALLTAEPLHGRAGLSLGDLLDPPLAGRRASVRVAAATVTIVISLALLVAELIAAGALAPAVLFLPQWAGICFVGLVILLVTGAAGMLAASWIQAAKTVLLVLLMAVVTALLLHRGLSIKPAAAVPQLLDASAFSGQISPGDTLLRSPGPFADRHFVRVRHVNGSISTWKFTGMARFQRDYPASTFIQCQVLSTGGDGAVLLDNLPLSGDNTLAPAGFLQRLPIDPGAPTANQQASGSQSPLGLLSTLQQSSIGMPHQETFTSGSDQIVVLYPDYISGADFLSPGLQPAVARDAGERFNFLSLMVSLAAAAMTLPHLMVRSAATRTPLAARNGAAVATIAVSLICVLLIPVGLFAAVSGQLDPTSPLLSLVLLGNAVGPVTYAFLAGAALVAIIASACGQLAAISGAVAHDLVPLRSGRLDHRAAVGAGKITALVGGVAAIVAALGLTHVDPLFLITGACDVAAASLLPAIVARLCMRGPAGNAATWSIVTGGIVTLGWLLLSPEAFATVYHLPAGTSPVPFTHPTLLTIPLSAAVLVIGIPRTRSSR